jgi:hypothetical protein
MLATAPRLSLDRLPVCMWGRYLPDLYAVELYRLLGLSAHPDLTGVLMPGLGNGDDDLPILDPGA